MFSHDVQSERGVVMVRKQSDGVYRQVEDVFPTNIKGHSVTGIRAATDPGSAIRDSLGFISGPLSPMSDHGFGTDYDDDSRDNL